MTFDSALLELMEDTVTIEPFAGETSGRVKSFGSPVTYQALIDMDKERVISPNGKEIASSIKVLIPERLNIDQRSRITLPTGFTPNQPPIIAVRSIKALGLDHTEVLC